MAGRLPGGRDASHEILHIVLFQSFLMWFRGEHHGQRTAGKAAITVINQDPQGTGWVYAVAGQPDASCVEVESYARILDQTIAAPLRKSEA
jgi:hypothetical protein